MYQENKFVNNRNVNVSIYIPNIQEEEQIDNKPLKGDVLLG